MLTLGISAYYHDSAACLLSDSVIVGAAHEERFTRQKQDSALPLSAVRFCLDQVDASIADVDLVAFYEQPIVKRERQQWQAERRRSAVPLVPDAGESEARLRDGLGWSGDLHLVEHHRAHAASAYYVSGFDEAAVLVCDAVGEWDTTTFWSGNGMDLTRLASVRFPHSLGLFYSCLTEYLGFRSNSDEYKVMGLASYGRARFAAPLHEVLRMDSDGGGFMLDTDTLDFLSEPHGYLRSLEAVLGVPARAAGTPLTSAHMDLAASAQAVLEEAVTGMLGWLRAETGASDVCLAGGVALNCRANAVAFESSDFARIFVQPAAGDAGTALGAALCAEVDRGGARARPAEMRTAYLGPRFDDADVARLVTTAGLTATSYADDEDGLLDAVSRALAEGRTVGWFQGRMEFGPRALGARSILADPRFEGTRERLNRDIKLREEFRPFAPAVLAERADELFVIDRPSPFMIDLFQVLRPDLLGAVTHVDGTARVQTVNEEVAPRYYRLIARFGALTGVPVLLNTSFNLSDEPIVCTPLDALRTFLRSSLDLLCIEDHLIDGREMRESLREAAVEDQRFLTGSAGTSQREIYSFF